jgi:hypothetical protein
MRHRPHRKRRLQRFLFAAGTCLPSYCLATMQRYGDRPTDSPFDRHGSHRKRALLLCIRYRWKVFTEPLPCNDRWYTYTDTQGEGSGLWISHWCAIRCHDIDTKFHNIGSIIPKLVECYIYTYKGWTSHKLNSVARVRERTLPTERPPLVGEVGANFCG